MPLTDIMSMGLNDYIYHFTDTPNKIERYKTEDEILNYSLHLFEMNNRELVQLCYQNNLKSTFQGKRNKTILVILLLADFCDNNIKFNDMEYYMISNLNYIRVKSYCLVRLM